MGTVSDLLSLAGGKAKPEAFPPQTNEQPSVAPPPPPSHSERATFADIGSRIGEDNEVLRNLLIDTSHQLTAFDDLKDSFTRLIDPLNNVLTTLEQEKADNAAARGALSAMRNSHETLRADYQQLERRTSEFEDDNERLRQDLEHAVSNAREIEAERAKLAGEIAGGRNAMAMIVKQLGEETNTVRLLQEEKSRLTERAETSENRAVALEAEVAHVRERLSLLGSAKDSLQASLDKTLGESSRMGRQLAETETALSDARARIQQMETALAVADAERNKLAAACDEANERRQSEVYALGLKLEALRSHSDAAEKLLGNARQSLRRPHRGNAGDGVQASGNDRRAHRGRKESPGARRDHRRLGAARQDARTEWFGPDGALRASCRRR